MTSERFELVVFSGETVRVFELPLSGRLTLGRDPANDVPIEDVAVSRQHAVLHVGASLDLEDLGGANGTFVRQSVKAGNATASLRHVLGKHVTLSVGDCLLLGTACGVLRRKANAQLPSIAAGIVLRDPLMQALYADAARVARANINVLLLGETGVGKEVLARAIHDQSPRAKGPFIAINCAALAESLLESELFGSEKGAFTGALTRTGLFEAAQGGTLFLDEVGELPLSVQAKLLRVLEERAVTRIGSTKSRPIDVRILAATNRDLEADTHQGRMRADFYFRLNGVALNIPPLRARPTEIMDLAQTFLLNSCRDLDREPPLVLSQATLERLTAYTWPGNVRELRNAMDRAAVMCAESVVLPEHLPANMLEAKRNADRSSVGVASAGVPLPDAPGSNQQLQAELSSIERRRIEEALESTGGNQSEAARRLGMPRRTLVARLASFGLTRRRVPSKES